MAERIWNTTHKLTASAGKPAFRNAGQPSVDDPRKST